MTDLPTVCTLSEEGLRARKQRLLTKIPAGYRFEFDAWLDTLSLLATTIDAERRRCRFLQFELNVGPDL